MNERDEIRLNPHELKAMRRTLHRIPEIGFEEHRTAAFIAERLDALGYTVHRGMAKTGVAGTLRNGSAQRAIGLRADMDGLPIRASSNGFPAMRFLPSTTPPIYHRAQSPCAMVPSWRPSMKPGSPFMAVAATAPHLKIRPIPLLPVRVSSWRCRPSWRAISSRSNRR